MFQTPYAARQQYLAAQEEARVAQLRAEAAKAEYLAQEALLQEEAALKARLYEIEQRKRYASTTPFAPNPFNLGANQYISPQQPYAAPYPSFTPPGLSLATRQGLPSLESLELQRKHQLEIQTLERFRKEAELDRLRKEHQAKLVLKAELEWHKRQLEAIKAAEAFAQIHYVPRGAFPAAQREGTKTFCSAPTLNASPPKAAPRSSPFSDVDGNFLLASLFGVPTAPAATKPQTAPKAAPKPSVALPAQPKPKAAPATKPQASLDSPVDQLKARFESTGTPQEDFNKHFLMFMNALSGMSAPVKQAPKEVVPQKPSVEASLVDQLHARSKSEPDQELRDTIQATLNSLLPLFKPTESPASASASHSRSISKAKAEPEAPSTPSVESRLEEVRRIENEFRKFESEFVFPSQLDFVPTPNAATTGLAHLAYTARNHPVRFYEQALGSLLTELDSIESQGDVALRSKRKETVNLVERALENLEEQIMDRWNSFKPKEQTAAEASASFSVPIVDANVPEEDKADPSVTSTPAPASEEVPAVEALPESVQDEPKQVDDTTVRDETREETTSSTTQPESQLDADNLAAMTLEELEQLEEFEAASPSESQLTIKALDASPSEVQKSVATSESTESVANLEASKSDDGFLAQDAEGEQLKSTKPKVEDLGSDWSDVEA